MNWRRGSTPGPRTTAIAAVVVRGAGGRAFCAGGDIRRLSEAAEAGDDYAYRFWHDEYRLNALIGHYAKPYARYHRRHRHGRRGGPLGAWALSRGERACDLRHAGDGHRLLSRCRRVLLPAALPRADRPLSRPDRPPAERGGHALCRHRHAFCSSRPPRGPRRSPGRHARARSMPSWRASPSIPARPIFPGTRRRSTISSAGRAWRRSSPPSPPAKRNSPAMSARPWRGNRRPRSPSPSARSGPARASISTIACAWNGAWRAMPPAICPTSTKACGRSSSRSTTSRAGRRRDLADVDHAAIDAFFAPAARGELDIP